MDWFTVDKQGLAKLLERRGKSFAIFELWQNAADEDGVKQIEMNLTPVEGSPYAELIVTDDSPNGFKNLSHAFTLFAESSKKGEPEKRGRFNLGEKLVLALCKEAQITTTTGTVLFTADGRKNKPSQKTNAGSTFSGTIRMTREEYKEVCDSIGRLIVPDGIKTWFNGQRLVSRTPVTSFEASLPTEIADDDGILRLRIRKTVINLYETLEGENASIYEMGIPVVETGDKFHIDIGQKVVLNMDRDGVPPSYLQTLRTLVFNESHKMISEDDANSAWVRAATSDKRCEPEAVETAMDKRFGEKRVAFDPSDPEANQRAAYEGYTVVHGGMLNGREWDNVKRDGAILPAGKVTPSPKPYSEDGTPMKCVDESKWKPHWKQFVEYAKRVAKAGINRDIGVQICSEFRWPFRGTFGPSLILTLNAAKRGVPKQWPLTGDNLEDFNAFIIHELGHKNGDHHLSEGYHEQLCKIGARLMRSL